MKSDLEYVDGIACYAKERAMCGDDYPVEHFDKLFQLENNHFWFKARNQILLHLIAKYLGNKPSHHFLEIGCGTGVVLNAINQNFSMQVSGAELFVAGLKFAKQRMPDVEFMQLDARQMPFENQFDAIGAFDVIEHIDEDQRVIDNIATALRTGGYFFVSVPQHPWLWSVQDDMAYHKRRYERPELIAKLIKGGFDICHVTSFVTTLLPLMAFSRRRMDKTKPIEQDALAYQYKELDIPAWLSRLMSVPMGLDILLVKMGLSLPVGGSLLAVARKR